MSGRGRGVIRNNDFIILIKFKRDDIKLERLYNSASCGIDTLVLVPL